MSLKSKLCKNKIEEVFIPGLWCKQEICNEISPLWRNTRILVGKGMDKLGDKLMERVIPVVYLEKGMASHFSILAWRIPRTEEPGGLQSMGSLRVGHDWATSLSLFSFMLWRKKWKPTPVFSPGESQGWGSLLDCHLWGFTESDTTEVT